MDQEIGSLLGLLGIAMKYTGGGGGDPPMARLPCLDA